MLSIIKKRKIGSFVDNKLLLSSSSTQKKCLVTKKLLANICPIAPKQIKEAIASAHQTFLVYKHSLPQERQVLLLKAKELLLRHKEEFAKMMVSEMGKTMTEALGEVDYSAGYFSFAADQISQTFGQTISSKTLNKQILTTHEPVGVCGMITPWNFPLAMPARKISSALAAGCTCVIKPSPETPITMLLLAEVLKEAGFPKGACQVLIGQEKKIGKALLSSPLVRKLSFTGSTQTGKYLYKESASTLKKLSLELGGLAPFIVLEDANIEKAAEEAIKAKFRNSGQTCVAASYFLIHEKIFDSFTKALLSKVKKMKIGSPFSLSTDFSTYLHPLSLEKAKRHTQDALKKKAQALLPINPHHPQILVKCKKTMQVFKEETFSPIAPLLSFKTDKQAIKLANSTPFGLAAYLFTNDISKAKQIIKELEFGMIGLNDGLFSAPELPFGGVKESGFGREGGPNCLQEFLVTKAISIK